MLLQLLTSPDALNVLFALAGAAFGWWLKRHPDAIPPELADVVKLLLARHAAARQADAHSSLQVLAAPAVETKGK